jgi:tRNA G18 (ribose-2'-O)-methylase SpoU
MSSAQIQAGFAMAHSVDSLNVAAAATLAFFVVTRD